MVSATMNVVVAGELRAPVETRQAFLQTEQQPTIRPAAIAATDDGLIVAGYSGTRAWAAKTDAAGKIIWTYHVEKPVGYDSGRWLQVRPEFSCTAPMPDGSVWLIGSTIDANARVGLLVHLDRDGKVLVERPIRPPQDSPSSLLLDCARWADGVAIVGTTYIRKSTSEPPATMGTPKATQVSRNLAYWVLVLDAHGNTAFENVIPTDQETFVIPGGLTLLAAESSLVMSATTNVMTEVVRVGPTGAVEARKQFPTGYLGLVRPVVPDGKLQLLGTFITAANSGPSAVRHQVLITLDEHLAKVHRQDAQPQIGGNVTYRMPDQSLVVFGAETHDIGERYTSQIMHVDPTLQHQRTLSPRRDTITDTGMITTAAPLGSSGRFVVVTPAVVKGYPDHPARIDASPGFLRGAVLDFIELK
jgi:hypothetical protein